MDSYSFTVYPDPVYLGWNYFWFAVAVAASVTAGYLVYLFFTHLKTLGPDREQVQALHRKTGLIAAAVVSAFLTGIFYYLFWTDFYKLEADQEKIVLTYILPERQRLISASSIKEITFYDRPTTNGFVVILENDQKYYSMPAMYSTRELEAASARMNKILGVGNGP